MTTLLYGFTLFTGAVLLFGVQPMVGRLLLPKMGGSPVVWNTCLVFFQAALLLGYLYAHLSTRLMGVSRQRWLHLVLILAPVLVLPIAAPADPPEGESATAVGWLVLTLAVMVGLPFFAVSTTAPLLQRWYAATDAGSGRDPYFLYAASNLGSMLALFSYPFAAERFVTLGGQREYWMYGYLGLVALIAGCGALARRDLGAGEVPRAGGPPGRPVTPGRRLLWVALAFVPSSMLLGVTNTITTDVVAIPLLWVVPLGLYLLTFIIVFGRGSRVPSKFLSRALALIAVCWAVTVLRRANTPLPLVTGVHLTAFFVAAWFCHALLAADRPHPERLTEFYLLMSLGGVLGGLFNVLAAPELFRHLGLIEYPLAVVAALLFRRRVADEGRLRALDFVLPSALAAAAAGLGYAVQNVGFVGRALDSAAGAVGGDLAADAPRRVLDFLLVFGVTAVAAYTFVDRPTRFALGLLGLLAVCYATDVNREGETLMSERNHLGQVRVDRHETDAGTFHRLFNGSTTHGSQKLGSRKPLMYYHPKGPAGDVFERLLAGRPGKRVGAVGLGVGAMATYAKPGERWTFFELDPLVVRVAENPELFTFLSTCEGEYDVVIGDARVGLRGRPDGEFDALIMDAFSSDAIPTHLLTREAFELYKRKLKPDGVLLFHISNRYLDLAATLGRAGAAVGWTVLKGNGFPVTPSQEKEGRLMADWLLMGGGASIVPATGKDLKWRAVRVPKDTKLWTDDFIDFFGTLSLRLTDD